MYITSDALTEGGKIIAPSPVGVNFKSGVYYFHRLREIIAYHLEREANAFFSGEIEVDESYFSGKRKGQRGRGADGKVPVFDLLKRGGKFYTKVIPEASSVTLCPIIERKVVPDKACSGIKHESGEGKFHGR